MLKIGPNKKGHVNRDAASHYIHSLGGIQFTIVHISRTNKNTVCADTSIKCQISGQSTPMVKGCLAICLIFAHTVVLLCTADIDYCKLHPTERMDVM